MEIKVAAASLRNHLIRKDAGKRRTAQHELFDESQKPTIMQMIAKADELHHRGKDTEAEAIYAGIGRIYISREAFRLAGGFFRKAKMFPEAANAFMRCKEYFSAGRCFESAKDRKKAVRAYSMAGEKAERSKDLGLAHHVYNKAGRGERAQRVKEKAEARLAAAEKMRAEREKDRKLRLAQKLGNGCLLPLPRFRKRGG